MTRRVVDRGYSVDFVGVHPEMIAQHDPVSNSEMMIFSSLAKDWPAALRQNSTARAGMMQ